MGLDGDWWQLDGLDFGGFATKYLTFYSYSKPKMNLGMHSEIMKNQKCFSPFRIQTNHAEGEL